MAAPAKPQNRTATEILEGFRRDHAKDITLSLRPAYKDLLSKLGDPHLHLPPVFHVAGTNGKGSTCAFLRSILEAAGYKVHVYTSPHLMRIHERIRVAGKLISEDALKNLLLECEAASPPGALSYFEASTAAAFAAFARTPADFTLLETGLGGRLDATNVVPKPLATLITRLSFDHREYLGNTHDKIAREKAGIMRQNVPCFTMTQYESDSINALRDVALKVGAPLIAGGQDWHITPKAKGFHFKYGEHIFDMPLPSLIGQHQIENAGLALAALTVLPKPPSQEIMAQGLQKATWPARLQKIENGQLAELLPAQVELWLDGGHNDSAGSVLAEQAKLWRDQDGHELHIILGMLTTKLPCEFLAPLRPYISSLCTVAIADEPQSFSSQDLAIEARACDIHNVVTADSLQEAITLLSKANRRLLITGSLYLAGQVLRENGSDIEA
ncbi:MAG: folylpolyglutamate synthase/dihydrofolate synthase family protein [Alphaproteobacteria bacterium]